MTKRPRSRRSGAVISPISGIVSLLTDHVRHDPADVADIILHVVQKDAVLHYGRGVVVTEKVRQHETVMRGAITNQPAA